MIPPAIQAAIDGHPCTVHGREAHLICWNAASNLTARIHWPDTGTHLTVRKTDITPTPCNVGCDWCQP